MATRAEFDPWIPISRVQPAVVHGWITASPEQVEEIVGRIRETADFLQAERQEIEERGAPRERLAERLEQGEVRRSREDESPRDEALVDHRLDVGEQVRDAVHLVEDRAVAMPLEKPPGVPACEFLKVGRFEGDVGLVGKNSPAHVVLPDCRGPVIVTTGNFPALGLAPPGLSESQEDDGLWG